MKRKTRLVLQASAVSLLALGLAGCGGGRNSTTPAPGQTTSGRFEDQFGLGFGTAFRVDLNGEPLPVSDGDLIAVSFTTEPVAIN